MGEPAINTGKIHNTYCNIIIFTTENVKEAKLFLYNSLSVMKKGEYIQKTFLQIYMFKNGSQNMILGTQLVGKIELG